MANDATIQNDPQAKEVQDQLKIELWKEIDNLQDYFINISEPTLNNQYSTKREAAINALEMAKDLINEYDNGMTAQDIINQQ